MAQGLQKRRPEKIPTAKAKLKSRSSKGKRTIRTVPLKRCISNNEVEIRHGYHGAFKILVDTCNIICALSFLPELRELMISGTSTLPGFDSGRTRRVWQSLEDPRSHMAVPAAIGGSDDRLWRVGIEVAYEVS